MTLADFLQLPGHIQALSILGFIIVTIILIKAYDFLKDHDFIFLSVISHKEKTHHPELENSQHYQDTMKKIDDHYDNL